jgi:hypothetical protein
MSEPREPVALSGEANELAGRMASDPTVRLDVAYQLLRGREQIAELRAALDLERRRVDVCVRAMTPTSDQDASSIRSVLRRAAPPLLFFVAGMIALALCLLLMGGPGSIAAIAPAFR